MWGEIKKGEKTMPRVNIYFTEPVFENLKHYVVDKYGVKKALSMTVEEAVKTYLKRQLLLEELRKE